MMRKLFYMILMAAGIALGVEPKEINSPEVGKLFLEPESFKISITSSEGKWEVGSEGGSEKSIQHVVHLENTTDSKFVGLRIDFCTYHARSNLGHEYIYPDHDDNYRDIPAIKPHSIHDIKLRPQSSTKREEKFLSREFKGVRLRVYLPLADGREAVREIRFPEDEMSKGDYVWVGYQYEGSPNHVSSEAGLSDPNTFSVSAQAVDSEWKTDPGGTDITKDRMSKSTRYKVLMEYKSSNSDAFFSGVRVDYRIYRKRKSGGETYISTDFKTKAIGRFRTGTATEVLLDDRISYKSQYSGYEDEVLGARIRVYVPFSNGKEFIREIQIPSTLSWEKYPWKDPVEERIVYSNSMDMALPFLDTSLFKISTMKREQKEWKDYGHSKGRGVKFSVQLENGGKVDLYNVRMEYCLYSDVRDDDGRRVDVKSHIRPIGMIDSGSMNNQYIGFFTSFKYSSGENRVVGGRFRVYLPLPDGSEVMREVRIPEDLSEEKYPWKDPEAASPATPGAHKHSAGCKH